MAYRFKEARMRAQMSSREVAESLGVTQPTMSHIENEKRQPTGEQICNLADLYGVTTDYLLGRDEYQQSLIWNTVPIDKKALLVMNGVPVWMNRCGWGIVNSITRQIVFSEENVLPFAEAGEIYSFPPPFATDIYPISKPLLRSEVRKREQVWVEPLGVDMDGHRPMRGWYSVDEKMVQNERGEVFGFDTYEAKWLAFEKAE